MSNSINYIQNSNNISSSTSIENNDKFITVKYLNSYNEVLCKNIIDLINRTLIGIANQSCAFIDENENNLIFHYSRNDSTAEVFKFIEDSNFQKTFLLDSIKYFKLPANVHALYEPNQITSILNSTSNANTLNITLPSSSAQDEWRPAYEPLISIASHDGKYRLNIGQYNSSYLDVSNSLDIFYPNIHSGVFTGTLKGTINGTGNCTLQHMTLDNTCSIDIRLLTTLTADVDNNNRAVAIKWKYYNAALDWTTIPLRGGVLASNATQSNPATELYWSDNSDPSSYTTIPLPSGGGGGTGNFPQDIFIEFKENNLFLDRNTVLFIDYIGGKYQIIEEFGCRVYSYSQQQDYLEGQGRQTGFEEDKDDPNIRISQPIRNAVLPLGAGYAIAKLSGNSMIYTDENNWQMNFPYGSRYDATNRIYYPVFNPNDITEIIENNTVSPGIPRYPFIWTDIDKCIAQQQGQIIIPAGSIVMLNVIPSGNANCGILFSRIGNDGSQILSSGGNARIIRGQYEYLPPRQNN